MKQRRRELPNKKTNCIEFVEKIVKQSDFFILSGTFLCTENFEDNSWKKVRIQRMFFRVFVKKWRKCWWITERRLFFTPWVSIARSANFNVLYRSWPKGKEKANVFTHVSSSCACPHVDKRLLLTGLSKHGCLVKKKFNVYDNV